MSAIIITPRRRISPSAERQEQRRIECLVAIANSVGIKPRIIVKGGK